MGDAATEAQGTYGAGQLLRALGGWGRPSGRGLLLFRSLMVNSSTAAVSGLACAALGGLIIGAGAQGFLIGSCAGFVASSVWYYFSLRSHAYAALSSYPRLLQLHLVLDFPTSGFDTLGASQLRPEWFRERLGRTSMLMSAYMSACGAIEEIHDRRERAIIEELNESMEEPVKE